MDLSKDNWNARYLDNNTGWDIGYPSTPIKEYINQIKDKNIKILIPGCGNAHEATYLLKKGFTNLYLVDFSSKAINSFLERNPELPYKNAICDDFFNLSGKFDLILEQTFFCALDPKLRANYSAKSHELLNDGGKLSGLFFYGKLYENHPPFGGSQLEYEKYFENSFNIKTFEKCYNSIDKRKGKELFFIFEKK